MISKSEYEPRSITGRIGVGGKRVVDSIVKGLASLRIHPNILTLIGMVINIFAMVLFAKGIFTWAALVIMFAGIFDIVDGEVARRTKRETKFGAFFDSVIDRYSDLLLLLGLIIWYAKINRIFYVGLTGLVLILLAGAAYAGARETSVFAVRTLDVRGGTPALSARRALGWVDGLELSEHDQRISRLVLREISERLRFLDNVGVGYLSMNRAASSLSSSG